MTPADIEAIRARLEKATPGEWQLCALIEGECQGGHGLYVEADNGASALASLVAYASSGNLADADLIAHAPTDLRALLNELAERDRELARAMRVVEAVRRHERLSTPWRGVKAALDEWEAGR